MECTISNDNKSLNFNDRTEITKWQGSQDREGRKRWTRSDIIQWWRFWHFGGGGDTIGFVQIKHIY